MSNLQLLCHDYSGLGLLQGEKNVTGLEIKYEKTSDDDILSTIDRQGKVVQVIRRKYSKDCSISEWFQGKQKTKTPLKVFTVCKVLAKHDSIKY